jgi:hypothetical protein
LIQEINKKLESFNKHQVNKSEFVALQNLGFESINKSIAKAKKFCESLLISHHQYITPQPKPEP